MDIVYIRGLRVQTVIGVYDWERTIRQPLLLDLDLAWDNRPAAENDDLKLALDYAEVSQHITQMIEASQYQLIETLAEKVAHEVMQRFSVPWLRLTISKPTAVGNTDTVGVVIERGAKITDD
ncbi:MAG: dihydroneopterin aldolase [Pseudomonadales bacterium]|uniref:7,8-dihydroneopterin aldolase n=1 Tax=Oleiphilus messinensis TaxID=141451 RepID=A0A1Y0IGT9_9GAMM|nr:dihydroneopterin aldolase [Oleiphilus messinensis]ARU58603.1 dihydroneopterin aldolase [Oleiphilus messinensis]MCG8613747.1 dihydroneopterin aldolase [Pseudomonadales bacterium]